ncbi:receptor kinase-like protein Xa21 [Prunus persica]|uniref:receptor kinase-like protein Xa21 n=1 Tax=Prunus persica TaxID=3760 RepID=UPI0009AB44DD|nr:receptor kinase-like protein Xa21 [Prunus persica]
MPKLEELYLSENHLNGTIPPSICNMQDLTILFLKSNHFSGEFPLAWSSGSHIRIVDAAYNNLFGNIPATMGVLSFLEILKLNNNNFGGKIPHSLHNCSFLKSIDLGSNKLSRSIPPRIGGSNVSVLYGTSEYVNEEPTMLTLKGQELVYNTTLMLVKSIDLSSNFLEGEIPQEICSLTLLGTLNLSRNQLTSNIPSIVGSMHMLETLDLSHNHLSGHIPQSLASLTFLSHLNLSYNNLVGRIPLGSQLQTLSDSSIYMDNPSLCGVPLPKCLGDDTFIATNAKHSNEDGNDNGALWFYVSMILGFIVGFWGVCGTLLLKKSWRYAYFRFFDDTKDKVTLAIALKVARLQRKFHHV